MATNKELLEQVRTLKGKLLRASHEKRKLEEKKRRLRGGWKQELRGLSARSLTQTLY